MTNDEREQRLHAILHDYLQARDRGETPDRQQLLDAHPDLRDELAAYFADASRLEQLARSLHTATFRGEGPKPFVAPTAAELKDAFPNLEILELLGQGGMGAVYKARHKALDRFVAVKILPGESGPAFAERFTREARALARLSHPHIVGVHDFGQTASGLFYFVMEYIDGVTLRQALRTGLTPEQALAIVPQICDALQFAHDEGIVHRDIKPENVLLDRKGRVKIADFGLAKLLGAADTDSRLTGTNQVMGTLRYMAPEQMEGAKVVDHRADIYSLGVVFYELLTGELPMGRFAPPSKKVHIDVRLDEVVLRALEKEPEQRWQQASAVKTEVEAIGKSPASGMSQPQPIDAVPNHKSTIPSTRHSRWPMAGMVFLVTLIALIGHNGLYRNVPPTPAPWIALSVFIVLNIGSILFAAVSSVRTWFQADMSPVRRVRGPALAMIVCASLGSAVCLAGAIVTGVFLLAGNTGPHSEPVLRAILVGSLLGMPLRIATVYGAISLLSLRSRGWAITSSVLMLLPTDPLALVAVPLGLWALLTLLRDDVTADFEKRATEVEAIRSHTLPVARPAHTSKPRRWMKWLPPGLAWLAVAVAMHLFFDPFALQRQEDFAVHSYPRKSQNYRILLRGDVATFTAAPYQSAENRRATALLFVHSIDFKRQNVLYVELPGLKARWQDDKAWHYETLTNPQAFVDWMRQEAQLDTAAPVTKAEVEQLHAFFARWGLTAPSSWSEFARSARETLTAFTFIPSTQMHEAPFPGWVLAAVVIVALGVSLMSLIPLEPLSRCLLVWAGCLQMLFAIGTFLLLVGTFINTQHFDGFFRRDESRIPMLIAQTAALTFGIFALMSGIALGRGGKAGLARTGANLLMVPLTPSWPLTLPMAIWARSLLTETRVEPVARPVTTTKKAPLLGRLALVALGVAILLPLFLQGANVSAYAVGQTLRIALIVPMALGLLTIRHVSGYVSLIGAVVVLGVFSAVQLCTQQAAVPIQSPLFGDSGFLEGPNGPLLGPAIEARLGIPPHQVREANGIFQRYYNEYTALERRHTKQNRDQAGHIHITIGPFADDMYALMTRLHAELSGIVDESRAPPLPAKGKIHNSLRLFRQAGEGTVRVELWKDASGQYCFKGHVAWLDEGEGEVTNCGPTIDAIPREYRLYWSEGH